MRWVLVVALAACGDNRPGKLDAFDEIDPSRCVPTRGKKILLRQIATYTGGAPLLVTGPEGDPRQFVVHQDGKITIIERNEVRAEPFLDLSADASGPVVAVGGERGLLGLAFHPSYATNGTFFVYYTTLTKNVVARYRKLDDTHGDPASGTVVLEIEDFASNHNGGMIEFGDDGMLYIGTGDGGGTGDPELAAQDPFSLLGKFLRIDVDEQPAPKQYAIPAGNPFFDGVAGAPEVYMLGLRNPWRWSFDRETGDIWIGDVGQDLFEELDFIPAAAAAGANFGWSTLEGDSCFRPPCNPAGTVPPVVVRSRTPDGWCSVIAGQVYRGKCYPDLRGMHLFSDYCTHVLEAARVVNGVVTSEQLAPRFVDLGGMPTDGFPVTPSSLHADGLGELYLTTMSCRGSSLTSCVYRLEASQ